MLSIVFTGRDDNYGNEFIPRFKYVLQNNLEKLERSNIEYEIVIVDFNPINGQFLHINNEIKHLLDLPQVKNVIVDQSVLIKDQLSPNVFYEYFAKNIGARWAKYDNLFLTGSDIMYSEEFVNEIKKAIFSGDLKKHFYRSRYRAEVFLGQNESHVTEKRDLHVLGDPDELICGLFSGDAELFSKEVFCNIATGFNEIHPGHRGPKNHASLDGEILWNCYHKGITLKFLDAYYMHIFHGRFIPRDETYDKNPYINRLNWGFIDFPHTKLNHNSFLIHA